MVDYIGYSTVSGTYKNDFRLYDVELVKQDLLNEFFVRKGERLMFPRFGFIGWELLFEPITEENRVLLEEDTRRIVNSEPRVELRDFKVYEEEYGFTIEVLIQYVGTDLIEPLSVTFDRNATA